MRRKIVKYKITDNSSFGNLPSGTVINAVLLVQSEGRALLYHPHVREECPSFEICRRDGQMWVSVDSIADLPAFVNVPNNYRQMDTDILGKGVVFERELT